MRANITVLLLGAAGISACRNFGEPAPRLTVTPPSLTFTATAGGLGPPPRPVTVDAIGGSERRFNGTAVADQPWLFVDPVRYDAPTVAWVSARIDGLAAGSYAGALAFRTVSPPLEVRVPVTLVLTSAIALTGRWVGARDTVTLSLELTHADTSIAGTGTINRPLTTVSVRGVFRDPDVTLSLIAPDSVLISFVGSVVNEQAIAGVLNGGRFSSYALTIFRQ